MQLRDTRLMAYGRGRPAWTPSLIQTALWLDAADASTITLNGSTVSQWRDKSGNARHVAQATAANQPTYTANGLNGKPVLTFDGINDFLQATSFTVSRIVSVMVVASTNNTAQNQYLLDESNSATYGGGLSIRFATTGSVRFWGQDVIAITDIAGVIQGAASIIGGVENNSVRNAFLNGVSSPNSIPGTSTRNALNPRIGHSNLLGGFLDGIISEIVLTDSALSTTDRQRLEGYLAWKWGLQSNLPANHPYKNSPPTV